MENLQIEVKGNVGIVMLQSPPANALSSILIKELSKAFDEFEQNEAVKAVVIQGEGRFFSAGADIKEFTSMEKESDFATLSREGQLTFDRIENFRVPVIASIHGAALGGGLELAMACNIRIVTKGAKLGLPELTLGLVPGFAGTQRLPRYVGLPKAYEMILTGDPISGEEAVKLGLANQAVEEADLSTYTMNLAEKMASKSGPSIHAIMKLLPYAKPSQYDAGAQAEAVEFGKVFSNEDAKEGIQAFFEKRKPSFKDQ